MKRQFKKYHGVHQPIGDTSNSSMVNDGLNQSNNSDIYVNHNIEGAHLEQQYSYERNPEDLFA